MYAFAADCYVAALLWLLYIARAAFQFLNKCGGPRDMGFMSRVQLESSEREPLATTAKV